MGSTPYYVATITARELVATARPAKEYDSWAGSSIDERMQREPDLGRVKRQIVPYLAQHKDRFFGSIIVVVSEGSIQFESMAELVKDLPRAYRSEGEEMGFLTIGKGERIILDGQHRWYAEREVIQSHDELGDEQSNVGDDDLTVIFVENRDPRKTRRIFNKVNRYAKPTSRSDNILTSEDDGYAIVTRMLLDPDKEDAPLADREFINDDGKVARHDVVQWRSNTLSRTMRHLTTIAAVYDNTRRILEFYGRRDLDRVVSPPEEGLASAYDLVSPWFIAMTANLDAYREALADPETLKINRFDHDHPHTLLLRPVGQIALVRGLTRALDLSRTPGTKVPRLELTIALQKVNNIDFRGNASSIWRDTIVRADGRMVARNESYNLAAGLISYLIAAEYHTQERVDNLWRAWNEARGKDTASDVDTLSRAGEDEMIPEDLPSPVQ